MKKKKPIKTQNIKLPKTGRPSRLQPRTQDYFIDQHGRVPRNGSPIDHVLGRLERVTQSSPGQWGALCPAHPESNPSLSIGEGDDGRVLLTCHSGCDLDEICEALGIEQSDLFRNNRQHSGQNGQPKAPPPRPKHKVTTKHTAKKDIGDKKDEKAPIGLRTAPGSKENWTAMVKRYESALPTPKLLKLAKSLGVTSSSLKQLRVGWWGQENRFTFPERNGKGEIVGISTRALDGAKRFLTGGKRGLYIRTCWEMPKGPIFIVEGASDTAALITLGLAGVGRPSATGGVDFLADLLADLPPTRPIVVVAEYDTKRDGSWPGLDGAKQVAKKLSNLLGRVVRWILPPGEAKDIRAWLQLQKEEQDG